MQKTIHVKNSGHVHANYERDIVENIKKYGICYIQDPGHGWIGMPLTEFRKTQGIEAIVDYTNGMAYLEEGCSAPAYMDPRGLEFDDFTSICLDLDGNCVDFIDELLPNDVRWITNAFSSKQIEMMN